MGTLVSSPLRLRRESPFSLLPNANATIGEPAAAVLFALGLAGGIWAISFADFFYEGTNGVGAWILRAVAVLIGVGGIVLYKRKQDQCSVDPKRKRKNLILLSVAIAVLGAGFFLTLDRFSTWYFNKAIVPAQQTELAEQDS